MNPLSQVVMSTVNTDHQMHPTNRPRQSSLSHGFTLVEMLVVIAITIILFALLLRPLVEALHLTQSAQTQAAAQDSARTTIERLTRELGSAVFVYDNSSHPFTAAAAATGIPAGARVDHFTNFLDFGVTKSDGTIVVEHGYDAKLDIVPARHSSSSTTNPQTDPTNGNSPIQLKAGTSGSATLSSTGLLFPLAPDSTIVRYFVGLKDPTKPYTNSNEGLLAAAGPSDNTYILYVAQVLPYQSTTTGGTTTVTPNATYFATAADGKSPELDDPDFFRYVTTTDVNWLSPTHATYSAADVAAHNTRVDNWAKIAKSVITAPDIDLLQLPHNPDGSIDYDTTGTFANVAHSGVSYDAISGTGYPIVDASVSFRPALIEGDAAPGTTTDYASLGIPANAADDGGLPYVPSFYTAANQSWGYPYNITLYPLYGMTSGTPQPDTSKPYYTTGLDVSGVTGDIIEYYHTSSADTTGTGVYDVTTNLPVTNSGSLVSHDFVPMSVKPDTGTISFDTPAYPDPTSTFNRFYTVDPQALNGTSTNPIPVYVPAKWQVDLTQFSNSPLAVNGSTSLTGMQVANAHIVPGSVRVYGPDATPGPNFGSRVLYSMVSPGTALGYNQYRVDYLNSQIYFFGDDSNRLAEVKTNGSTADPVQIAFDYQANLSPIDSTSTSNPAITSDDPANPMLVKIDYQTRDLLDITIGVRIYDSSQGRSIVIPVSNRVQIGNSNR
jgi:prepilin-type N-terminal cleavage/methylation domain-containing protein